MRRLTTARGPSVVGFLCTAWCPTGRGNAAPGQGVMGLISSMWSNAARQTPRAAGPGGLFLDTQEPDA